MRLGARGGYAVLLGLTAVIDCVPARLRFGLLQRLLVWLAPRGGLQRLPPETSATVIPLEVVAAAPLILSASGRKTKCLIMAGELDTGGIETVVAILAQGLPAHGVSPEVVCTSGGNVADAIRRSGTRVTEVGGDDGSQFHRIISDRKPDVVQLHRVDARFMNVLRQNDVPTVPVFHAMESYLSRELWRHLDEFLADSPVSIAVSSAVRDFFLQRMSRQPRIRVIVNCAPPHITREQPDRGAARRCVGQVLGLDIHDDLLIVSLSRFSDQKNVSGLVDAFLRAAEQEPRLRLVVAGAAHSWLEVRRADILRRTHPAGERVHLLETSDANILLAAADAFALNSFSEGGPVSAVEAAVHGLPMALSDVGFARKLVDAAGVSGIVVPRANRDMGQAALAHARRQYHQTNRAALASALVNVARAPRRSFGNTPEDFSQSTMVAAHAETLNWAAEFNRA